MADTFPERLAGEVRARRRTLHLTQRDLAELAGLSERFIRSVERGKPSVQLDSVLGLLDTLGLDLQLVTRASTASQPDTGTKPLPNVPPLRLRKERP